MGVQRKIGLLGGSFNPPTLAHLQMADYARAFLGLDEVHFLVSPQNPLKPVLGMADFHHRLAMCRIATRHQSWIMPSDIESRYGTTRTIDMIEYWRADHPDDAPIWLMGGDNWRQFHHWHRWQELAALIPMAIFRRGEGVDGRMGDLLDCPAALELAARCATAPMRSGGMADGVCWIIPQMRYLPHLSARRWRRGKCPPGLMRRLWAISRDIKYTLIKSYWRTRERWRYAKATLLPPSRTSEKSRSNRIHYVCINGGPETIRTSGLCLRRATLYPAELRVH